MVKRLALGLFRLLVTAPLRAQTAELSGRLELHGSARSLDKATVTLCYIGSLGNTSSHEARLTTAAGDGRFVFESVPGMYVLQVDGPGLLSQQWGAGGPELAGRAVVLHEGQHVDHVLLPVTSRPVLCGQVLGPNGKPVANADVHAWYTDKPGVVMDQSGNGQDGSRGGNVMADAEGRYRFTFLAPSFYVLGAGTSALVNGKPNPASWTWMWMEEKPAFPHGRPIHLTASSSESCSYDIHIHPSKYRPYSSPRFRVAGALPQSAIPETQSRLEWNITSKDRDWRDNSTAKTSLPFDSASPSFAFEGIAPGKYTVALGPPMLMEFSGPCMPLERVEAGTDVTIAKDVLHLLVPLRSTASVAGKIDEEHSPKDTPWNRSATARYYISLIKANEIGSDGSGRGACTAANEQLYGSFTIKDLDPGYYHLHASISVRGNYESRLEANGETVSDSMVHLQAGENTVRIVERFDSGTIFATLTPPELPAPAVDASHHPLIGASNVLVFDDKGELVGTTIGASQGRYKGELPPGHYVAVAGTNEELRWAWAGGRWTSERVRKALGPLMTAFQIRPGEVTKLALADHTIEMQNLSAERGLEPYRR